MMSRRRLQSAPRAGFTILEILIVIVIITIIASLLLPAIRGAIRQATLAKQVDDMTRITQGLEAFKTRYGMYPPSRIRLREGTAYNLNEGFDAHSVKMLKRIWPNIVLTTYLGQAGDAKGTGTPSAPTVAAANKFLWCVDDYTGTSSAKVSDDLANGGTRNTWNGIYELEGDECVVFFLGGIAQFSRTNSQIPIQLNGFTKRPNDPSGVANALNPATLVRDDPLVAFEVKRLMIRTGADQIEPPPTPPQDPSKPPAAGVTFPAFPGPITQFLNTTVATIPKLPSYLAVGPDNTIDARPYAYFSGYEGQGYRADDFNLPSVAGNDWFESANATTAPSTYAQQTFQRRDLPPKSGAFSSTTSSFPNPYTESDPGPLLGAGQQVRFLNATTYQIISPGIDGKYGPGGKIPRDATLADNTPTATYSDLLSGGSSYDNITNVSGSQRLGEFNAAQGAKN